MGLDVLSVVKHCADASSAGKRTRVGACLEIASLYTTRLIAPGWLPYDGAGGDSNSVCEHDRTRGIGADGVELRGRVEYRIQFRLGSEHRVCLGAQRL